MRALWQMVRGRRTAEEMTGYDALLERHQAGLLTSVERLELTRLRQECDRLMLCKAQAAVSLRWRGHPPPSIKGVADWRDDFVNLR